MKKLYFFVLALSLLTVACQTQEKHATQCDELVGKWTGPNDVVLRFEKEKDHYIAFLDDFHENSGIPARDVHNKKPEQRYRVCKGMVLDTAIRYAGNRLWTSPETYAPESGHRISANLEIYGTDSLVITQYVLAPFFGKKSIWKRAD